MHILNESFYMVVAGSNDFLNNYYVTGFRRYQYDINSYTNRIVAWASNFVQVRIYTYKYINFVMSNSQIWSAKITWIVIIFVRNCTTWVQEELASLGFLQ